MPQDISEYCRRHNCGKCCERDWDYIVTPRDIERWKSQNPDLLKYVTTKGTGQELKTVLRKKKVRSPSGTEQIVCIFYDFAKKCLIYEMRPEKCRSFTCIGHPLFLFKFLNEIAEFIAAQSSDSPNLNPARNHI
jgi:Fe-S-cluster containining protein